MSNEANVALIKSALGVSDATAALLAVKSRTRTFQANAVVYYQDDPTTHIYLLKNGHVRLCYINEDGMVMLLTIMTPDSCFGSSGALDGMDHCDTAFTVGPTEVLALDVSHAAPDAEGAKELRDGLARVVARRYRSHVEFTRALYLPNLNLRLSHVLLWLLGELGNEIRFKGELVECLGPIVTQRDLGSMARGTRENVNKMLRTWEKAGIIALEDRHIVVVEKDALEDIARGQE